MNKLVKIFSKINNKITILKINVLNNKTAKME